MASRNGILLASPLILLLILSCLAETSECILFSSLPNTLIVNASPHKPDQVLKGAWYFMGLIKAGEDMLGVLWALNHSFPAGTDASYKTIKVKLCYTPASQVDRPWRKTSDNLAKDKTCHLDIYAGSYDGSSKSNYFESTLDRDVPTASYFLRAYVYDGAGVAVAYGQSTNAKKDLNIFDVQGITGRHKTLDVVSICFSVFSILSLVGFFVIEKTRAKSSHHK